MRFERKTQITLRRARGFSMIELMIAITLGLIIVAALLALFINITRNNNALAKANSQIENGRFAIQLLANDLQHAGYWADFLPQFEDRSVITGILDNPTALPNPCKATNTWTAADKNNLIGIPAQADIGTCTVTNQLAGTETLVVRHAAPAAGTLGGVCSTTSNNEICFQASQCALEQLDASVSNHYKFSSKTILNALVPSSDFTLHASDCVGTSSPLTISSGTLVPTRLLVSDIYYIRDFFAVAGDGIPTLMLSQYQNGLQQGQMGAPPVQPLVGGIQAMHIEYGIDNFGKNGLAVNYTTPQFNRGDGIPESYIACPCTFDQLTNAVAVKIYLLVRDYDTVTPNAATGYGDSKTYTLGTVSPVTLGPFNDGIKRHVFSTTVRLVNVSGRREQP
jgi:type IV pilus assembly protein PilW